MCLVLQGEQWEVLTSCNLQGSHVRMGGGGEQPTEASAYMARRILAHTNQQLECAKVLLAMWAETSGDQVIPTPETLLSGSPADGCLLVRFLLCSQPN